MPLNQAGRPSAGPGLAFGCEHGAGCHSGAEPAVGTAPERARSWLLIEHNGPWPADESEAELPGPLGKLAVAAAETGLRVQLIRRPGRRERRAGEAAGGPAGSAAVSPAASPAVSPTVSAAVSPAVFVGWAAGPAPWLRRGTAAAAGGLCEQLEGLPDGVVPDFGAPVTAPLYLVCAHGRRDVCCARLGGPLARALSAAHQDQVWETTHVGGHRYAANLVILPHGLYYGPVDAAAATAAADAYERGEIAPGRFRGRAGQPHSEQAERYQRMAAAGDFGLAGLG